jgi:hypothetical protein
MRVLQGKFRETRYANEQGANNNDSKTEDRMHNGHGRRVAYAADVFAQAWPGKPIRIVSGFAPGGRSDSMARALTPKLVEAHKTSTCR